MPTPLLQTPRGYFELSIWVGALRLLVSSFVFLLLIFKPLDSRFDLQYWKWIFNDSRECAAVTKLSAYKNPQEQPTRYSLASMTIANSKGLNTEP